MPKGGCARLCANVLCRFCFTFRQTSIGGMCENQMRNEIQTGSSVFPCQFVASYCLRLALPFNRSIAFAGILFYLAYCSNPFSISSTCVWTSGGIILPTKRTDTHATATRTQLQCAFQRFDCDPKCEILRRSRASTIEIRIKGVWTSAMSGAKQKMFAEISNKSKIMVCQRGRVHRYNSK